MPGDAVAGQQGVEGLALGGLALGAGADDVQRQPGVDDGGQQGGVDALVELPDDDGRTLPHRARQAGRRQVGAVGDDLDGVAQAHPLQHLGEVDADGAQHVDALGVGAQHLFHPARVEAHHRRPGHPVVGDVQHGGADPLAGQEGAGPAGAGKDDARGARDRRPHRAVLAAQPPGQDRLLVPLGELTKSCA